MSDLTVVLGADSSRLQKALNEAKTTLHSYRDEVGRTSGVTKDQVASFEKSVNALNKINNGNKSAVQQMKALENQIVSLTIQYNSLGEEAKNDKFGKALANTIEETKARFSELRSTTDSVKESLHGHQEQCGNSSDALGKLTEITGVNIGAFTKMTSVLGLGAVAYKGLEAVLQHNEAAVDEWGRTVEVSQSLYENFCRALNNSDLSSFFKQIDSIVEHARKAYNAIDDLATKGGIISNAEKRYNAQRAKYQKILKDPNATDNEKKIAEQQLKEIGKSRTESVRQTKELNNNAIKGKLREIYGNLSDENYKKYYSLIVKSLYDTKAADKLSNTYVSQGKKIVGAGSNAKVVDNKINLGNILTDEKRGELKPYIDAFWDAETRLHQDERTDNRIIGGGRGGSKSGGGGGSRSGETELEKANRIAAATLEKISGKARSSLFEIENTLPEPEKKQEKKIYNEDGTFYNPLAELLENIGEVPDPTRDWNAKDIEAYKKALAQTTKEFDKLGSAQEAISNVGSAFNSLGAAIGGAGGQWVSFVGTFAQGVSQMLPQFVSLIAANEAAATAEGVKSGAGLPFPANLGAIASIVATITSIFASLPTFADGGIIKGATSIGDFNLARVNSGEMILNGSQQGRLFNLISGNSSIREAPISGNVEFKISGNTLVGVLENYGKKHSRL